MATPPRAKSGSVTVVEYGQTGTTLRSIAESIGTDSSQLRSHLAAAGDRVARTLRLAANPFVVSADALRVVDVAGVLRVHPRLELQIAPKFLGAGWASWREDFFFLAMLSLHGRILAKDKVGAAMGDRADLAALVARALVTMYWENHRRPLRTYRRADLVEFVIDGDVDPESLVLPEADGYRQQIVSYDRRNSFNAAILAATQTLLREVREPQTRQQLARIAERLAPQRRPLNAHQRRVPSRSARWQSVYDLSVDVLKGFGATFDRGALRSPGFILHTWHVWEDLLTVALRLAYGSSLVGVQREYALGQRTTVSAAGEEATRTAWVKPDMTVHGGAAELLVDAKYKGRAGDPKNRVSESDLYEALAFASAAKQQQVVLVYPAVPKGSAAPAVGAAAVFERITVGAVTVTGMEVEVRDISRTGALRLFAQRLKDALESTRAPKTSTA